MTLNQLFSPRTSGFFLGVFVFLGIATLSSCDKPPKNNTEQSVTRSERPSSPAQKAEKKTTKKPTPASASSTFKKDGYYTFVFYNLRNYLDMWRYVDGERTMASKPEEEIRQLISVIAASKPDILGICEIGTEADLEKLQGELKQAGVDLPHTYLAEGSDDVRRLGILSRYPLAANPTPPLGFTINGDRQQVRRGIADAYVNTPTAKIRLLGIHFKSKREVENFSQETIRRNEAYTLRKHLISIHDNPETANDKILVYGDFNDTTRSTALKTVIGSSKTAAYCKPIPMADKHGLNWTHHWKYQDVYSRFDFVLANKAMQPHIEQSKCHIPDVSDYPKASDHRPLVVKFK